MKRTGQILQGDCVDLLRTLDVGSIGLTVTSPPYDDMRAYDSVFNVYQIAAELHRVTRPGGVVVWIVADQTKQGDESGSSMRHALAFKRCGWKLHDTMIYQRVSPFPDSTRYHQAWEYMFVFARGRITQPQLLRDRPNVTAGAIPGGTERQRDGSIKPIRHKFKDPRRKFGIRFNVWNVPAGYGRQAPDLEVHEHPATFPLRLAFDHIRTWSQPEDCILDIFGGSGQTALAAELLHRPWIVMEKSPQFAELIRRRLAMYRVNQDLRTKALTMCRVCGAPDQEFSGNPQGNETNV